jgi:hypothetical protein
MSGKILDLEPDDEKAFLRGLIEGMYLPADQDFELQEHLVLRYTSEIHGDVRLYAVVVGRCFDGASRVASRVKIISTSPQRYALRDMIEALDGPPPRRFAWRRPHR